MVAGRNPSLITSNGFRRSLIDGVMRAADARTREKCAVVYGYVDGDEG